MKQFTAIVLAAVLLLTVIPAFGEPIQYGYANADTVLRMAASEKAVQQSTIAEGTKVRIDDELPDDAGTFTWYKITTVKSNESGYVKSDDIDLVVEKKSLSKALSSGVKKGESVTNEKDYPVLSASGTLDPLSLLSDADLQQYRTLEINDADDDTLRMKNRLYDLGYITSAIASNKFTKNIVTYIKQFQKINGMTEDGVCSPEFQARLYSDAALTKKGKTLTKDDIEITAASVKSKNAGTSLTLSVKNNTKNKIDAYDYLLVFYNTYGERYCLLESLTDELTLLISSDERNTLKAGGKITLSGTVVESVFLAGGLVCITGYHTTDGVTVTFDDDQRHWYGFGKGVTTGYNDRIVTPLTDGEKKRAAEWDIGISGLYVDADYAEHYQVREGCLVTALTPGSAMDAAGLQAGDVLLAIGDTRIFGASSIARAKTRIGLGETVTVLYWRNGNVYVTTLTRPDGSTSA